MKAIVQHTYGSPDDLQLREVDEPVVGEDAVRIRVHAAALNAGDFFTVQGRPWPVRFAVGFPTPKDHILGWDVAGRVDAVGANVKRFQPGDEVFGSGAGTLAEYACATENGLATKPASLSFEQAAAVPTAGFTALQMLRDAGKIRAGRRVLINGASGGVGTFAVQIARVLGAEVTGVCSTRNVDLVRSLGADHVVDYTREDFTTHVARYDLILDNIGNHPFAACKRALAPGGVLVPNTGHAGMGYVLMAFARSVFVRQQGRPLVATPSAEDLVTIKEWIDTKVLTPVIDRTYRLDEAPEALSYIGKGHARGKVVIQVAPTDQDGGSAVRA